MLAHSRSFVSLASHLTSTTSFSPSLSPTPRYVWVTEKDAHDAYLLFVQDDGDEKAAAEKQAQEKKEADEKAAAEKQAQEKKEADEKAAAEKQAQEKKAADEKAAAEKQAKAANNDGDDPFSQDGMNDIMAAAAEAGNGEAVGGKAGAGKTGGNAGDGNAGGGDGEAGAGEAVGGKAGGGKTGGKAGGGKAGGGKAGDGKTTKTAETVDDSGGDKYERQLQQNWEETKGEAVPGTASIQYYHPDKKGGHLIGSGSKDIFVSGMESLKLGQMFLGVELILRNSRSSSRNRPLHGPLHCAGVLVTSRGPSPCLGKTGESRKILVHGFLKESKTETVVLALNTGEVERQSYVVP